MKKLNVLLIFIVFLGLFSSINLINVFAEKKESQVSIKILNSKDVDLTSTINNVGKNKSDVPSSKIMEKSLPKTNQLSSPIPIMIGFMISIMAFGVYINNIRNEDKKDEKY